MKSKQNSLNSGNIDRSKKAVHILKMPGLGEFCGYCFKSHTYVKVSRRVNVTNKFKVLIQLSSHLSTVMCFLGHPV